MRSKVFILLGAIFIMAMSCSYLANRDLASGPRVLGYEVRFQYYAPSAGRVQLAGDWPRNNWAKGDGSVGESNIGLMSDEDSDGVWEILVKLSPGRYGYLFLVDEDHWVMDPGNPEEVEGGPAGRCSQLILVSRDGILEIR